MRAGIALGSNIEPRLLNLQAARRGLFALHRGSEPVLCSKVYETTPVDCPEGSNPFLNAVLELSTILPPLELLDRLQSLETTLGRVRTHQKNTPRSIDLDLLYCDQMTLSTPNLVIPHPLLAQRRFVLQPLADIRPRFILPNFTINIEELLARTNLEDNFSVYCNTIY